MIVCCYFQHKEADWQKPVITITMRMRSIFMQTLCDDLYLPRLQCCQIWWHLPVPDIMAPAPMPGTSLSCRIGIRIHQYTFGWVTVAAGPTRFLVITFDRFSQAVMYYETDVWFIDAHTESDRSTNNLRKQ
uniref:Uncharacterized protein n=1 Tax=Romanomermis culicivorax TaxID=13658 RepID=A0A915J6N4_ROMCU